MGILMQVYWHYTAVWNAISTASSYDCYVGSTRRKASYQHRITLTHTQTCILALPPYRSEIEPKSPVFGRQTARPVKSAITWSLIVIILLKVQWPSGLRHRSASARWLSLWVPIPLGAWMFVSCECCVLSGRCLWDGQITRPEESYRLLCVVVCDLETSWMRRPWPTGGCCAKKHHY